MQDVECDKEVHAEKVNPIAILKLFKVHMYEKSGNGADLKYDMAHNRNNLDKRLLECKRLDIDKSENGLEESDDNNCIDEKETGHDEIPQHKCD